MMNEIEKFKLKLKNVSRLKQQEIKFSLSDASKLLGEINSMEEQIQLLKNKPAIVLEPPDIILSGDKF